MSEEDKAAARKIALEVIADYRDRGCPEPQPIGPELLQKMMQWLVCEPVPPEYVPMLLEEMELDGKDSRAVRGTPADDFPVIVIGCGESGLLAGIRLKAAGIPFTIVEKNAGVGGTWWQNTYPGARVDVGNHFYCYSFEPTEQRTHFFAEQPELQAYFQTVMDKYDIGGHVLWETEVTEATWDDATATWSVRARDCNGATTTLSARAVISAVGQLNRPHPPDIDGKQDFAGPAFHSSEWDHSVDLRGKRVAMIGAGASGFQIAPAIAGDVDRLTVFQRTAQWMFPNPNYHAEVSPGVQWALWHLPFYGRWYRFLLFWPGCDKGLAAARVDADYPDQQKAVRRDQRDHPDHVHRVDQQPGRRRCGAAGQGGARLPGDRQAHTAGQRQLVAHIDQRQRRVGQDGDRSHRIRRGGHRRWHPLPGRRHRVRHRIPGEQDAVADEHLRAERRNPQRALGGAAVGVSGHHRAGLSEFLLHVRARHQPRPRRQPDLSLRVPNALHHRVFRAADHRPRSNRARTRRPTGTNAVRPRCASWYGHNPRSSTLFTRTASARCTSCRRGGSSTTGRGPASRIPTTS